MKWFMFVVFEGALLLGWYAVQPTAQVKPYTTYSLPVSDVFGTTITQCLIITAQGYAVIWEAPCP